MWVLWDEQHTPRDRYWGDGGDGTGRNQLGKTLMRVREEIKASASGVATDATGPSSHARELSQRDSDATSTAMQRVQTPAHEGTHVDDGYWLLGGA